MTRLFTILIALLLTHSCTTKQTSNSTPAKTAKWTKHPLNPRYARGFTVMENPEEILFTSRDPEDTSKIYGRFTIPKKNLAKYSKLCITSTTHAFLFDALNANHCIIGMSGMKYIQDSALLNVYQKINVNEIGSDDNLQREKIILLKPSALMVYPYNGADYSVYTKAKIQVIYNGEYLEQNPLGKTEWIKLAGLLCNKAEEANRYFNDVENKYLALKKVIPSETAKPVVILGKPIDNLWHVPGSNSFAAQLVKDAGADYCFYMEPGNNVKAKNSEWILTHAAEATHWFFTDYSMEPIRFDQLEKQHKLFKRLKPFMNKQTYVCNSATSDYFGKAVIEPHIMLAEIMNCIYADDDSQNKYFKKPL